MPNIAPGAYSTLFPDIVIEKEQSRAKLLYVLFYSIVFATVVYVIKAFNVAPASGIADLAVIFIPGFIIHSLAPHRFRPFIYCLIFVVCLFYVFSWVTAVVIASFLALTAYIIFKDIKLWWKYLYLACLVALVFLLRNSFLLYMPRVNMSMPFIAALLMFRVIVLMYEVKYSKLNDNYWIKLSYFFCFPNLAFLYYPIIDYKIYAKSYYGAPFNALCNKALAYMMTGIVFLMFYKYTTYYLDISYANVHDVYSLFWMLLSKYLMVIKAMGYLILGLSFIYMFGFDMPPLFGNFLIATSFNTYWQRVNVYWRSFIIKIVYYPLYFKYRKKLKNATTTICIMLAVLSSWLFHVYQRFWLSGYFTWQLQDFLYWFLLATLVASNVYIQSKKEKKEERNSFKSNLVKGGGFVIVFTTMLVLWSLWNSNSVATFLFIMSKGLHATAGQVMSILIGVIVVIISFAVCLQLSYGYHTPQKTITTWRTSIAFVLLLVMCSFGFFKPDVRQNRFLSIAMLHEKMGKDAKESNEVGYYSAVTNSKNDNWEVGLNWGDKGTIFGAIGAFYNDLVFQSLQPNKSIMFNGYRVSTNSYGFRDKDYPLVKGPNTYRIALLGGSYEMGFGVAQQEVFEAIVEDSLNAYFKGNPKIEIINFGMGAFSSVPQLEILKQKVVQLHPDEIMVFYHTEELRRATRFFARYITNGVPLKYQYLLNAKAASGVKQSMSIEEIISRLGPYMKGITGWAYSQMDSVCIANNIRPAWIFLPTTSDELTNDELNTFRHIADTAGFNTYALRDVFTGYERSKIIVSDEDTHPNALGHRLIANKLFNLLVDSTTHIIPRK